VEYFGYLFEYGYVVVVVDCGVVAAFAFAVFSVVSADGGDGDVVG